MRLSLIVAMAANRVIGKDGQLPWHLPEDLARFKQITMGHTLIMGRKTFQSIGRALPGRDTIVLSRQRSFHAPGCQKASGLDDALQLASGAEEVFICGGEELYRQALPQVERIYLTVLDRDVEGDTFFPDIPDNFCSIREEQVTEGEPFHFSILERA